MNRKFQTWKRNTKGLTPAHIESTLGEQLKRKSVAYISHTLSYTGKFIIVDAVTEDAKSEDEEVKVKVLNSIAMSEQDMEHMSPFYSISLPYSEMTIMFYKQTAKQIKAEKKKIADIQKKKKELREKAEVSKLEEEIQKQESLAEAARRKLSQILKGS